MFTQALHNHNILYNKAVKQFAKNSSMFAKYSLLKCELIHD